MILFSPPRLAALFGVPLERLQARHVLDAVAAQVLREDEDLDFKKGAYHKAKAPELVKDVAAFANARGGIILLGVHAPAGLASEVHPLLLDDATEREMGQWVASQLVPVAQFGVEMLPLPDNPSHGFYLLTIPPSPLAPHAQRLPDGSLRYPQRRGSRTDFLSESEIADAYRNRFQQARAQVDALDSVQDEGCALLSNKYGWLTLALVPNARGRASLDHHILEAWRRDVATLSAMGKPDTLFTTNHLGVGTRARRAVLTDLSQLTAASVTASYAELHTDGSGFVAWPIFSVQHTIDIRDYELVQQLEAMLRLLTEHGMLHTGATGDAVVQVGIHNAVYGYSPEPIYTNISLSQGHLPAGSIWPRSRHLTRFPVGQHTIAMQPVVQSSVERLIAVRMLLTDTFQAFGVVAVPQVSSEGQLCLAYWPQDRHPSLKKWATSVGVELSATPVA